MLQSINTIKPTFSIGLFCHYLTLIFLGIKKRSNSAKITFLNYLKD